jgi:ABC-type lipoprotein export system ATPase subunit/GNAT superfamily N-acetyltransferase
MASIELKTKILNDRYTEYVYEAFDIQNKEETSVSIPMDLSLSKNFDWNIGVILGGSGSGKTTILKQIGDVRKVNFDFEKPLISNFDWLEPKEATLVLTSMGLSSVPTWLRPFHTLSNGEQYRATLAFLVASAKNGEVILIDEYTSVVDRDVAKAMSFALQKYIRREKKRIILASCHYDILEWLMPDWTCSPQKGGALERCDYLRQGRPQIELQISRVEPETWNFFKKYHYLTEEVNKSCKFFLFEWNEKPIAIVVLATNPSGTVKNSFRLSRTVVLPDYQGLGIGSKISEFICSIIEGKVFTKTVNPALGKYRENSKNWRATAKNMKKLRVQSKDSGENIWTSKTRPSYCFEYIGESISGYEDLLLPIEQMRIKNTNKYQTSLF